MNVRSMIRNLAAAGLIVALFTAPVQAQSTTRVFELTHVEPRQLASTLELFDANLSANDSLGTLTVRADAAVMPAIEDVVARLDVPRIERAAEVTAYVLRARDGGDVLAVPQNLQPVVEQLQSVFAYSSYELLDTLVIRGVDGRPAMLQGTMDIEVGGDVVIDQSVSYHFQGDFRIVSPDDDTDVLRINNMSYGFGIPLMRLVPGDGGEGFVRQSVNTNVGINTDVEIPADSQVVVGKATVGDSALILVMTVEFLN